MCMWATRENREVVEGLRSESDNDWLIVAGDVAELISDIEWALRVLRDRFHTVIWVPGIMSFGPHQRSASHYGVRPVTSTWWTSAAGWA
jgi:hypothetical protein